MALAKGASMAGTATCSGEGGMIPPERDLSTKWYYQVIQSRYGFNPHHLMLADGIEVIGARLDNGLLAIELVRPQAEPRVRSIRIDSGKDPAGANNTIDITARRLK